MVPHSHGSLRHLLWLALSVAACGGGTLVANSTGDLGASAGGGGGTSDRGVPGEGGNTAGDAHSGGEVAPTDRGLPGDRGVPTDRGLANDLGVPDDHGVPNDLGLANDRGVPTDRGLPADRGGAGGTPPDANRPPEPDAARPPEPDAARPPPPDAAHPPDPDAAIGPPPPRDPVAYMGSFPLVEGYVHTLLRVAGLDRQAEIYLPPNRRAQAPLIIALHGTTGTGADFISNARRRGWEDLADAEGVVIIAPTARDIMAGDWDQHGDGERFRSYWETLPVDDPSRGADPDRNPDLLFIRAVIAEAWRTYDIDPRRVYVVGFSNGGFFSLHVAVVLAHRIAAFAEASSGLVRCPNTNTCHFQGRGTRCDQLRAQPDYCACDGDEKPIALPMNGRMPPGWITHSTDDHVVSVYYSCDLEARMQALGHEVETHIRDEDGGHTMPATFARDVWTFLSRHSL